MDASGAHFPPKNEGQDIGESQECTYEEDKAVGRSLNVWRLQLHSSHNWGLEVDVEDAEHVKRM